MSEHIEKRGPGRPRLLDRVIDHGDGTASLAPIPRYNPQPDMKEFLQDCALRLELGAELKAGCMDSESRHMEVANTIKSVMLEIAAELRAKA